ncbi:hypothetical protein [Agrobacterium cavarae]|jgi:hypothetical protein|uniref:hypothetical protein n=1 Tax=Agrobacterium cavarae TaxID=2528239 RepID=UPI000DDE3418|nr:hypothetical protein [Agrobacterium cavarae]
MISRYAACSVAGLNASHLMNLPTELVEKTIAVAMASYPLKDDEEPVDVELFRIVRRLALQKFGITEGRVFLDKKGSAEPEAGQ